MARFGNFDQYLANDGNPLVSGRLYFFETGTTTPKTTYADINNSIANTNPVILTASGRQPNVFFEGVAKAILTDSADVQIAVQDPVGETGTDFGNEWIATRIYSALDVVRGSDGIYYRSLVNANQNNNPVSTSGSWALLYSVQWNAGITYAVGALVTYNNLQYQSVQGTNLNQNPSTAGSYWVSLQFAWLSTITYAIHQNVIGTDGVLYTSLQNSNTNQVPASSAAWWAGSSAAAASSASAAATSATAAETAETNAETAETGAVAAKDLAVTAQTNAATSETNAETAETNAEASENSAQIYAAAAQSAVGVPSLSGNASKTLSVNLAENGVEWASINSDPILGFANKSSWADGEQISIALDSSASAIAKAHVSVYEEIPQTDVTNSIWDVITNDLGFTLVDSAYSVTLTPAATTGGSIEFTLGSGSWASTDIGKVIKNKSAGEAGEARVRSVASGVATCKITVDFTNTDAIASGDWEMYSGEFTSGSFELSSSVQEELTTGTPVVFESASTIYISVTMLTSTKAIVAYRDGGNSGYGTACILDVSGSTITAGTAVVFESANTSYISVTMLTSTKAIVTYQDAGNSSYGTACILDVSGSTITAGTSVVFESAYALYISVTMLTSTKAIVAYRDNGNSDYGTACILDVSGSTITAGTPAVFESANTSYISVTMLTSTKAIVAYQDGGNSYYGTACILDVSGSTITAGTPVVFESATTLYISVTMLTSTKAIVAYRDNGNSSYGTACILDVSGSTITAGTSVVFESATTNFISVTMLTSTKAIVTYTDGGNSSYGTACILDVSGSTITAGTAAVFESATTTYISVTMLTSTKAIVTYTDGGNSNYGTSAIIDTETALYVTDQHVSAISGADTVDTTFYTDLNSVTATETLNSQTANYVFSFNPTLTSDVVTGGSFIVIGNGETAARTIASSLASVHGGVDGTWYYNSNAAYASETWASSTINTTAGAVEQAQTVAANNMSGTDVGNVADGNWPAFGTKFALGIVLKSTSTSATPSVDKVLFDYDANVLNQISYGYEIDMPSTDLVRVTAPSSGGPRNARVYISK